MTLPQTLRCLNMAPKGVSEAKMRKTRDVLDHIEAKRGKDGRWKLDDSLNGKTLADIERKGKPSKWVTLRALMVLHQYRGWEL